MTSVTANSSREELLEHADEIVAEACDPRNGVYAIGPQLEALRLTLLAIAAPHVEQREQFETWAQIDLMGHTTIWGHIREITIGGRAFFQLTMPEGPAGHQYENESMHWTAPEETRIYSTGAVYSLEPLDEETCRSRIAYDRRYMSNPDRDDEDSQPF